MNDAILLKREIYDQIKEFNDELEDLKASKKVARKYFNQELLRELELTEEFIKEHIDDLKAEIDMIDNHPED